MIQRVQDFLRKGRKGGILRKVLAWYLHRTRPLILYHGASDVHAASIRNGINPQTGANFEGWSQFGEGFYTTTSKSSAQFFAENTMDVWGGNPIIIRFKIPRNIYRRLNGYDMTASEYQQYSWQIPEYFITKYVRFAHQRLRLMVYLRGSISGFEELGWIQVKFNPKAYQILNRYINERCLIKYVKIINE